MSQKHDGCNRQFIHTNRAWYGPTRLASGRVIDEITIGMYHPEGGTTGEFAIRWVELGRSIVPMLCAFDDAWSSLSMFNDVLDKMASVDDQYISPDDFCKMLVSCGVEDATPTENPNPTPTTPPDRLYEKPDSAKGAEQ